MHLTSRLGLALAALVLLVGPAHSLSSPEVPLVRQFVDTYNGDRVEALVAAFTPEMRQALPDDQARAFFAGLRTSYGAILTFTPTGTEGPFGLYKVEFERGVLTLKFAAVEGRIAGFQFVEWVDEAATRYAQTRLSLPFEGTWYVFWGGETEAQNYHVTNRAQRGAYDFVVREGDKSFRGTGERNEDYLAYGKPVLAPCDGTVVMVVDGVPDNQPGRTNPYYAPGNTVMIRSEAGEYVLVGHLVPGSPAVRVNQKVTRGQLLGRCGNSGNSSEPHVHLHVQDGPDLNQALGLWAAFEGVSVDGVRVDRAIPTRGQYVR